MNKGTRIRTALYIVTILNQANVALGVWEFGNETVNLIYKIVSYLLTLAAGAIALWFNNDFTPEAAEGTGLTRLLKAQKADGYIGEVFDEMEDTVDGEDDIQTV